MGSKAERLAATAARLAAGKDEPPRTETGVLARDMRDRAANEEATRPLVNEFAAANGDYVGEGNRTKRNRGGTPIARWKADNLLSETQCLAIEHCIKLWERAGRFNRMVMDPLRVVGGQPASGWAQQEALDDLKGYKKRVPQQYWSIFENVCRFDMPTGVAGSELSDDRKTVNAQTRAIVCFVADLIAMWERLAPVRKIVSIR